MANRDPEKNFEELWTTFYNRYPFFKLRKVDWQKQYDTFGQKSQATRATAGFSRFLPDARPVG